MKKTPIFKELKTGRNIILTFGNWLYTFLKHNIAISQSVLQSLTDVKLNIGRMKCTMNEDVLQACKFNENQRINSRYNSRNIWV